MIRYKIPSTLDSEINELDKSIQEFLNGTIDSTTIKSKRVPFGVYEQRIKGNYMLRLRCPGGIITPDQLLRIAELAGQYGRKELHLTTRQEIQIHDLPLDKIVLIMRELAKVGLSSRGGGGNTVRNILASVDSGIDKNEIFDVEPHLLYLTNNLIADSSSWGLPRKFKIALSSTSNDSSLATVQDFGLIAEIKDGKKGFKLFLAGGQGAKPSAGHLFYDFVPEEEILNYAVAARNIFNKNGNRKNRYAARLRFLWTKNGKEKIKKLFEEELISVRSSTAPFSISSINNASYAISISEEIPVSSAGFELWKKRYVREQKQEGLYAILIPVLLGDLEVGKADELARFLAQFGENSIRFTLDQNIRLRNIPEKFLGNVFNRLHSLFDIDKASVLGNIAACAGASTCQLGICLSRGAASAVFRELSKNKDELDSLSEISIRISGCPNSCGQHHTADIGFFGTSHRKDNRIYPSYYVTAGAFISGEGSTLSSKVGEVSARDLPVFLKDALFAYRESPYNGKPFHEFTANGGASILSNLLSKKYADIPSFEDDKNYYFDWGASDAFSLAKRGTGECSAGLFDFIERDQSIIEQSRKHLISASASERISILADILFYSARMLLITRGIETGDVKSVLSAFRDNFIETNLVSKEFVPLFEKGSSNSLLSADESSVTAFSDAVLALYDSMDDSLNFASALKNENQVKNAAENTPEYVKDLRGVACPMNFVKTKVELSKLKKGDLLEVLLDDGEPVQNVPGSVKGEGHDVLSQTKTGDYWKVVIRKQ